MWSSKRELLDEQKSKHASLAQQNGFGPAFFLSKQFAEAAWYKAQRSLTPAVDWAQRSLTPAVDWLDSLISPGRLLVTSTHTNIDTRCSRPIYKSNTGADQCGDRCLIFLKAFFVAF
jgi:hypothetical protein